MVSPQELCALLRDASWLGSPVDYPEGGPEVRRYLTDLALPLSAGGGRVEVRKAAYVDIGPIRPTERGCEVHIAWRSATLAPLFPVFAGRLWVDAHGLRLDGYYAPPGGRIGMAIDRAILHIAARGTARWFLERVAAAVTVEASLAPHPEAAPGS
jgi:hypothetical protein